MSRKTSTYLGYTIRRACVQGSLSIVYRVSLGQQWFGSALDVTSAKQLIRGLPKLEPTL